MARRSAKSAKTRKIPARRPLPPLRAKPKKPAVARTIKFLNPEGVVKPFSRYSQAADAPGGFRWLHISGQVGATPEGKILEGRLRFAWIYSENLHRRETIERLAAAFEESLRGLIAHARSAGSGRYTPSDFPNARMSEKDLGKLVASIKSAEPGVRR